jgi:enamine deaminase RidA (YjgF/YER057c/UK114 family)
VSNPSSHASRSAGLRPAGLAGVPPVEASGGETPPKPAAEDGCATRPASPTKVTLDRQRAPGLEVTTLDYAGQRELHLTVRPLPGESTAQTVGRLVRFLKDNDALVARQEVFGAFSAREATLQALRQLKGEIDWPVTFLQGGPVGAESLAGVHVLAVAGAAVETVALGGRPVGRTFRDPWARHLLLGDLRPTEVKQSKPDQARQAYESLEAALRQGRMDLSNLARTWLFLDDILSWYGPFNDVRTNFYRPRGVFDRVVPASTGVSGRNAQGAALVAGAWAVEPQDGAFWMREVASPKQCPAPCYGSSFSRAVELGSPGLCRLLISGTASIEPGGASVCGGDVEAQIDLTMEVVRSILVDRGMDYPDVSRATAYFKRPKDAARFEVWRARQGLEAWPVVCTQADICRDELLFEIEADALRPASA